MHSRCNPLFHDENDYQKYILTKEKNHGYLFLPSKILDWPLFDLSILTKQNKTKQSTPSLAFGFKHGGTWQ